MTTRNWEPKALPASMTSGEAFSPLDNELPVRWMRGLRLVRPDGLGAGRRALFLALLTWLPIVVWAIATGRLASVDAGESLLHHYAVHVRCLVVIPLLILGEPMLHRTARQIAARIAEVAIAGTEACERFERAVSDVVRIRDATMPWVLVAGVAIAWSLADAPDRSQDGLAWAFDTDGSLGFGGWWFAYIVRPVFIALLCAWLWRILLVTYWFWRIGRVGLALVPTHPDRAGGIAFVEKLPGAFALVSVALSAVLASRWAHEIVHHGVSILSHRSTAILFAALWTLLLLLPLLALAPALIATRARAIAAYGDLVGRQGALVHQRWIDGETVGDEALLDAPEIGPVADAAALYEAVRRMRPAPIGLSSIAKILVPLALPLLLAAALQVPLKALLLKLLKVLA